MEKLFHCKCAAYNITPPLVFFTILQRFLKHLFSTENTIEWLPLLFLTEFNDGIKNRCCIMSQFENKPDRQTSLQANENMLKVNNKDTKKNANDVY